MRIRDVLPTVCGITALTLAAALSVSCGGGSSGPQLTLEIVPYTDADMHLQWVDIFTTEDGYEIWRDDGSGGAFTMIDTTPPDFVGYDDTTFTTGLTYKYYVIAYQGATDLGQSNTVSIEARAAYVTIITPNGAENLTLGQTYNISWVTNLSDFDARIFLATDGGVAWPPQFQLLYSWAPNGSPWPWKIGFRNIEEDPTKPARWRRALDSTANQCKIFIRHYSAVGAQDWSDAVFTITVPADTSLATPTTLVATPISSTRVDLTWSDVSTAEQGFRIYRNGVGMNNALATVPANTTAYTDNTVTTGTYTYVVVAYSGNTESMESNVATAIVP